MNCSETQRCQRGCRIEALTRQDVPVSGVIRQATGDWKVKID